MDNEYGEGVGKKWTKKKERGTEFYLFAVQLRNVIVSPNFFLFSMKPHSSAFVLEDLFLARPRDATAAIYCNKSSGCIYGPYM